MKRYWIFGLIISIALLLFPQYLDPKGYHIRLACTIFLFAGMAQAWNIVGGLANQISLGHAGFFGIGAYTSTILLRDLGLSPWLGMLCGMGLAAFAAALLSFPTFRLKGPYFSLATLAFGEVMRVIANSSGNFTGGPQGLTIPFSRGGIASFQFSSLVAWYYILLVTLVLICIVFYWMSKSKIGFWLRAIRENEDAAEVAGIPTFKVKLIASLVSAALIAMCGTLFAQFNFFFDPDSIFSNSGISLRIAMMTIIGGIGTLFGPMVGALFIIPLEEIMNSLLSNKAAGLSPLIYGCVLIAMILLQPKGLVALFNSLKNKYFKQKNNEVSK